jgi:transcriptional regulator GlxA family with amidase domain
MVTAYLLFDRFTALDIVGPHDVLSTVPGAESVFVAESTGPISSDRGSVAIVAERLLEEVDAPDVLVVPGGYGTRALLDHEPVLSWLRRAHQRSRWTASVCTGSLLLAAAGLLDDVPATTHWLARERLSSLGARVMTERVVQADRIVTAAGVSSGIDMALRLVQLMHGTEVAEAIQLGIEYDPDPPVDSGSPEKAPAAIVDAVSAVFAAREAEVLGSAER